MRREKCQRGARAWHFRAWSAMGLGSWRTLVFRLSMISAQALRVCCKGKPVPAFPNHAPARSLLAAAFLLFQQVFQLVILAEKPLGIALLVGGA
jgi:hypothetical protein